MKHWTGMNGRSAAWLRPAALLLIGVLLLLQTSAAQALSWTIQKVDEDGNVGQDTSLALDADGRPHISYYDFTNQELKYAVWDGSEWELETVDAGNGGQVGQYTSLALDANGNPHISYYDLANGDLKYATSDGTNWTIEKVDDRNDVGQYTSLALDADDNPHISYYDEDGGLWYAVRGTTGWAIEFVDAGGMYSSLALDADGNPHISYFATVNVGLWYAKKTGASWSSEMVDSDMVTGQYTSLALDADGRPHISYYSHTYGDLRYVTWDGHNWVYRLVDSEGTVGQYTSLALDADDRPHISYFDVTNQDLKYTYWDGTDWVTETVDSDDRVGQYSSLALNADGHPRISYYHPGDLDLKYAEKHPSASLTITKQTTPAGGTAFPFILDPGPYSYDRQWSERGYDAGQMQTPRDVAVDAAGNNYVSDYTGNRVSKFDRDGNFLRAWGWGVADGSAEFQICTDACQRAISGSGEGQLGGPGGIALDADGNVWVTEQYNDRVQQFDSDGNYLSGWPTGDAPMDVAVGPDGQLYIVHYGGFVNKYSPAGVLLDQWGSAGSAEGEFKIPYSVAVDYQGNVYIVDVENHRVQKFTSNGDFVMMWGWGVDDGAAALQTCTSNCQEGLDGSGAGQFDTTYGLAVDRAGNVYVSEIDNSRIQKFSSFGEYLSGWTVEATGDDQSSFPIGIAVDGIGDVYAADTTFYRVLVFTPDQRVMLDDGESHTFSNLAPGKYQVVELVPDGWAWGWFNCSELFGDEWIAKGIGFVLSDGDDPYCAFHNEKLPSETKLHFSTKTAGTTDDGVDYGPEDILMWRDGDWSLWFDGSAVFPTPAKPKAKTKHNINAFWVEDVAAGSFVASFAQNRTNVPGVGPKVDGTDLVRYDGSAFSLWFDGSDVGLEKKTAEKIDGLHVLDGSVSPIGGGCAAYLLISTQGPGVVDQFGGGVLKFSGEDVLGFCMTNGGENTAGFWHMVLDGSAEGLKKNVIDSISANADGRHIYVTTNKPVSIPADGVSGGHSMIFSYDLSTGDFSGPLFSAAAEGLPSQVDGLNVVGSLE